MHAAISIYIEYFVSFVLFCVAFIFLYLADDFDGIHELHPTNVKHLYMVDAGLTFNSPYPLVLRPQRAVDIILSFDFSARPSDSTQPFKVRPKG